MPAPVRRFTATASLSGRWSPSRGTPHLVTRSATSNESFEEWYPAKRYDSVLGLFGVGSSILPDYLAKVPVLLNPGGHWILMTDDDSLCNPAQQMAWKRFGVAEYTHDNDEIIGRELSGVRDGDVPTYGIHVGGPTDVAVASTGACPADSGPARMPPENPERPT